MTITDQSNKVTLGGSVTLSTSVAVRDPETGQLTLADDPGLQLLVTAPNGLETVWSIGPDRIVRDGTGGYHAEYMPDQIGIWRWRWLGDNLAQGASEGTFTVESIYEGAVTDIRDLRVLVPACRRAIDGPQATTPDAPSTTLNDTEVLGLLADATAELILNTASADGSISNAFGNQLVVVSRDPYYMAPDAWATSQSRSTAEDAAILSQAALNHYFWLLRGMKLSETMKNEAVEWTYTILSPNLVINWMNYLIANRDKAIAALQSINVVMDTYVSLVAERDRLSAAWLEPWVTEIGAPVPYVGGGGSGPLEYDYRFNTWG